MKKNKKLTKGETKKIKEKIKIIKKKIKPYYLKHEKSLSTATFYAWKLGKKFNKLKNLNRKLGVKWEKYRCNNFPYINEKKAQRCMRLARCIEMNKFPALTLIAICDLEFLIVQCKEAKESANEVLKEFSKSINFKKVPDDVELICKFKNLFKEMTNGLRPSATGWYDTDVKTSNYASQIKENRKLQQGGQRLQKKKLKKEGKIYSGTLIISINRAAKTLDKDFDFILNKKHKIVKANDFSDLDYETLKNLLRRLEQFKAMH